MRCHKVQFREDSFELRIEEGCSDVANLDFWLRKDFELVWVEDLDVAVSSDRGDWLLMISTLSEDWMLLEAGLSSNNWCMNEKSTSKLLNFRMNVASVEESVDIYSNCLQ